MDQNEHQPIVVVQNNLVEKLTGPVAKAAHLMGIRLHDMSSGDMTGRSSLPVGKWSPVFVVGSIVFCQQWANNLGDDVYWLFFDDKDFDAALWKVKLGDHFFNADGYPSTVSIYQRSDHDAHHIRPRGEMKLVGDKVRTESATGQESIAGLVVTSQQLAARNIDPLTHIWVSPIKPILAEIRIWMIDGKAAAASTYRMNGEPVTMTEGYLIYDACKKALECHAIWHPARHYVVDIVRCDDEQFRVMEYNPIHCSGWYGAEPIDIIKAFMKAESRGNHQDG